MKRIEKWVSDDNAEWSTEADAQRRDRELRVGAVLKDWAYDMGMDEDQIGRRLLEHREALIAALQEAK